MELAEPHKNKAVLVAPESLLEVLGVVYVHRKTSDGGDIYLTKFGLPVSDLLELENWYEKPWFEEHREPLEGTSTTYRVPTKEKDGRSLQLVVKNCRVGEDVPTDTRTLLNFLSVEFNSPWEEFALVMEMREGRYGPQEFSIQTQKPLAIYVPPEKMQMWQSGRSQEKINRIKRRHPDIEIDILRQYKLIYEWIEGKDAVLMCGDIGLRGNELRHTLDQMTRRAIDDLDRKGYLVVDTKPAHIIIDEDDTQEIACVRAASETDTQRLQTSLLQKLIATGCYSIVDYELLIRTPAHKEAVNSARRHSYLEDQRDRFIATQLPSHLTAMEILGVPYIHGHVESTGGQLWVVGRNARLFDYFLPERWRKTHSWRLSENNEVYYTVTKDNIHIVWKISRVGDRPVVDYADPVASRMEEYGYNSPFEAFAIAHELNQLGIPAIYVRAIYLTGSRKWEQTSDPRRFQSLRFLVSPDGSHILCEDHHYITLRGYYNGSDSWVARQTGQLYRPINLVQAVARGAISHGQFVTLFDGIQRKLGDAGYDGSLLKGNDMLLALDLKGEIVKNDDGMPDVRICNFEVIRKL